MSTDRHAAPSLIGHTRQHDALRSAFVRGQLAHALLFSGPAHVGKMAVALRLAAHALDTRDNVALHPDLTLVERGHDAKTGKLRSAVTIEQVRLARGRLEQSALVGAWKVAVIDGADELAAPAANALLKTLEEPAPRTLLILIAASDRDVLPTVRSRCDTVRFPRVSSAALEEGLMHRGTDPALARRAARFSDGRPGIAIGFVDDPAMLDAVAGSRAEFAAAASGGIIERFAFVDRRIPSKVPFQESLDRARETLDLACAVLHEAFCAAWGAGGGTADDPSAAALATRFGTKGCGAALDLAVRLKGYLDANVAPRAVLERFMTFLPRA